MVEIVWALAKRYLPQIVGALVILLALWYLHHTIYESGYEDGRSEERAEWMKEKVKTDEEARQVLEKHKLAYEAELSRQKSNLIGAFNESEKLRNNLDRDIADSRNHRMFVNTKNAESCSNPGKAKATSSGGIGGTGEKVYRSELDRETEQNIRRDYSEVAAGANACKVLLELVEKNFDVVK